MIPLISARASTVAPYFLAILPRVSPATTVWEVTAWGVAWGAAGASAALIFFAIAAKSGQINPRIYFPFTAMVRLPTLPPDILPSVTVNFPPPVAVTIPTWSPAPVQSPTPLSSQSYTQASPILGVWASSSTQMPRPLATRVYFSTPHSVPVYSAIPALMYAALAVVAQ